MSKLSDRELSHGLDGLPGWTGENGVLSKVFSFRNFSEAFAFMTRVALLAERADHHPDWSNSYGKVTIQLTTHSAGGVTQKDLELARAIEALRPV